MARVMRTYHERWRFRHPTSDDFYAVVAEVAGRDARWFFDQAVERPGHPGRRGGLGARASG